MCKIKISILVIWLQTEIKYVTLNKYIHMCRAGLNKFGTAKEGHFTPNIEAIKSLRKIYRQFRMF